ncbi:unnamed protein product [Rhizophagus irregularis]|nr:unnamed protein product [Rhizophagus irregularis]CAB4414722.1 unnamed protein product [Rhizophagus irregularis]
MVLFDAYPNYTMAEIIQLQRKNQRMNLQIKRIQLVEYTVSTLRSSTIYLCLAISSLVIVMTVFLVMSFTYDTYHIYYSIII